MFHRLAVFTTLLTLVVVVLGAYVRLNHAGLGCPDWPGCYGHLVVPETDHAIGKVATEFPGQVVEQGKAWKEMIHRYVAGTLGLLVLTLTILAWRGRATGAPVKLATFLLGLIIFQALLGMWTVTLLLKPIIVMGHLLGGLTSLACLSWLSLRTRPNAKIATDNDRSAFKFLAISALIVVVLQIALGGWTSANYAALACPDFPTCQGDMWPETNFEKAFTITAESGLNHEGGLLDNISRMTIHVTHRAFAIVVLLLVGLLALKLLFKSDSLKGVGFVIFSLLLIQIALGISNITLQLPLPIAAAHNGVAACLLISIVWLIHRLRSTAQVDAG
ncbi:MAG: COX15/CtaA family protein [Methylococcales bacterium]|nr:COX15/CtaA family protein [Methylococcales bacterium]MBT7445347.1 COX15/CtaA family protein [Methylococcales bacterium]